MVVNGLRAFYLRILLALPPLLRRGKQIMSTHPFSVVARIPSFKKFIRPLLCRLHRNAVWWINPDHPIVAPSRVLHDATVVILRRAPLRFAPLRFAQRRLSLLIMPRFSPAAVYGIRGRMRSGRGAAARSAYPEREKKQRR